MGLSMFSLSSPVTGGAQTGFTTPTYTIVADVAPDVLGKQWAVSALGGTQAGVSIHSSSSPFTVTMTRPKVFKQLQVVNPITGRLSSVPKNTWVLLVRKGAVPLTGQSSELLPIRCTFDVPAGVDLATPSEIRAAVSLLIGVLNQQSAGIGDALVTGLF